MTRNHHAHSRFEAVGSKFVPCKYLQSALSPSPAPQSRRGGFSLIEIAVSLAIFVFGALAIVRIFPRALGVVQNSEQRAIGQRMAQTTLAQYQNNPLSVPDSVIEFDATYNDTVTERQENQFGWSDFPGSVFGTRTVNSSLPSSPYTDNDLIFPNTPIRETSLGRFRRVVGESHIIKNGEVLLRFPYMPNTTTPVVTSNVIYKIRHNVSGVVLDETGELDFSNAIVNGIAFNEGGANAKRPPLSHPLYRLPEDALAATTVRPNIVFYISYSWREAGGMRRVENEPKVFPDAATGAYNVNGNGLRPLQVMTGNPTITGRAAVSGPVNVWFYQPYSATAPNQGHPTVIDNTSVDPALGRLIFTAADEGKRIFVDYTVRDWRALVVDTNLSTRLNDQDKEYLSERNVPQVNSDRHRQLVVPTRYVSNDPPEKVQLLTLLSGTINDATSPNGLRKASTIRNQWTPEPNPAPNPDDNHIAADPNDPNQTSRAIGVRPKTGQVYFDITHTIGTVTQPLASPFARIVYRNADGWSQQVTVAARHYTPYVAGIADNSAERKTFPREGWREYVGNGSGVMIFHASEAGKTFEVSYTYTQGGTKRTMRDVQVTTEREVQKATDFPPPAGFLQPYKTSTNTDATSDQVAIAYLPNAAGLKIGAPITDGGTTGTIDAVHSVKGVSLRVRSAWYEGNGYTQASVVGYRPLDVERWARN